MAYDPGCGKTIDHTLQIMEKLKNSSPNLDTALVLRCPKFGEESRHILDVFLFNVCYSG